MSISRVITWNIERLLGLEPSSYPFFVDDCVETEVIMLIRYVTNPDITKQIVIHHFGKEAHLKTLSSMIQHLHLKLFSTQTIPLQFRCNKRHAPGKCMALWIGDLPHEVYLALFHGQWKRNKYSSTREDIGMVLGVDSSDELNRHHTARVKHDEFINLYSSTPRLRIIL